MISEEHTISGKLYEVRLICDGITLHGKAFLEGKPANNATYSAPIEGKHALIESVLQDVADNRYLN